jgi:hypothetical protein
LSSTKVPLSYSQALLPRFFKFASPIDPGLLHSSTLKAIEKLIEERIT